VAQQNSSSETVSSNSPASSEGGEQRTTVQQPVNGASTNEEPKRLSLAELFADDENGGSDESPDDPTKPVETLDGLTKRLKITPEQAYAIKIPLANGAEPLTLGELKDRVGELVDLEVRELQFDQRRVKAEGELLRAQTEIRDLMALIPKDQLSPTAIQKVRDKHAATVRREQQATLEHIPEWQDEKRRTADITGMIELLSNYGFDETFIGTVQDHRALKFIRDSYLREKRISAALAKIKDVPRKPGQRPSGKSVKGATKPGNSSGRKAVVQDQSSKLRELFSTSD
jgi:hypothetical protein